MYDGYVSTYEKLLLIEPSKNSTNPVTIQAASNNADSSKFGNDAGITTYPNRGMAPKKAKEQNMTSPFVTVVFVAGMNEKRRNFFYQRHHGLDQRYSVQITNSFAYPPSCFPVHGSPLALATPIPAAS
jgi:hypothetical protein